MTYKERVIQAKEFWANQLETKVSNKYDLMEAYKSFILEEDYASAEAITAVLAPHGWDTADTHNYIGKLKANKL